ncbi:MAG: fumarylacetoacetate hydrolase family protein, partial [Myxococcota bacterium]
MSYVFTPPEVPSVSVMGTTDRFPVRRIFCIGRNYAKHALEMGGDPSREPPFYFSKPADAIFNASPVDDARLPYPPQTQNVHHEIELAVALKAGGAEMSASAAWDAIFGYASSVDLTRRDLQSAAKERGRPWASAKGFDHSAPIGSIHPVASVGHFTDQRIWLSVDGEMRQDARLNEMIWDVPALIVHISRSVRLSAGDV